MERLRAMANIALKLRDLTMLNMEARLARLSSMHPRRARRATSRPTFTGARSVPF